MGANQLGLFWSRSDTVNWLGGESRWRGGNFAEALIWNPTAL